ncbi:MAG: hypothetical protein H6905_02515 [Hyphomicrobiales bacterium]|nr:hypothetical protein [Hyphomicrobiales bacterium]
MSFGFSIQSHNQQEATFMIMTLILLGLVGIVAAAAAYLVLAIASDVSEDDIERDRLEKREARDAVHTSQNMTDAIPLLQ